jgi:hypothetical protein
MFRISNLFSGFDVLGFMYRLCFTIARFSIAAWVGAAALFVVTGVHEVRSPELDSAAKNVLAALRFPSYYAFGFALVSVALVCGLVARFRSPAQRPSPSRIALALLVLALCLMVVDYVWIYRPLEGMMLVPDAARPAHFQTYHRASMWINTVDVGLCLVAALWMCRPVASNESA